MANKSLEIRLDKLNETMANDPEKAVGVLLLNEKLRNLEASERKDIAALNDQISRVYDVTKWVLGFMATIVVGVFLSIATGFLRRNEKDSKTA